MKLDIQKFAIIKKTTFAESNLSPENNTSTLKITIEFSANNSQTYFSSATLYCTCNGVEQSKTVSHPAGGSVTKTFTFNNIKHKSDGTKTVSWNWSCATGTSVLGTVSASGTRKLTDLHKSPEVIDWDIYETNSKLSNIGIPPATYVKGLSQVKVELTDATYYDNASFSKMVLYKQNEAEIGEETTFTKYLDLVGNPAFFVPSKANEDMFLALKIYDNKGGSSDLSSIPSSYRYITIDYNNLTLSGAVKRVGQTSGQVSISCNGVYYNGKVGNINQGNTYNQTEDTQFLDDKQYYMLDEDYVLLVKGTDYNVGDYIENYFTTVYEATPYKPIIKYKFWETGSEEPDWDDVSVQVVDVNQTFPNDIIINDGTFEINNLNIGSTTEGEQQNGSYYFDYKKSYRLKIKVSDYFTEVETQELSITLGIPVWSEYPDHVDFSKLTINNEPIITIKTYEEYTGAIASGDNGNLTYDITKDDYTPIGIMGVACSGSRSSYISIYGKYLSSDTEAKVYFKNTHPSTALASNDTTIKIYVAYIRS